MCERSLKNRFKKLEVIRNSHGFYAILYQAFFLIDGVGVINDTVCWWHKLTHVDVGGILDTIVKHNFKESWYDYKNNNKLLLAPGPVGPFYGGIFYTPVEFVQYLHAKIEKNGQRWRTKWRCYHISNVYLVHLKQSHSFIHIIN